jgi:glycine cleavage system H protein
MHYKFDSTVCYATSHEWARMEGAEAVVGVSDYAQHSLSDVVFVELPEVGRQVKRGKACAVVESVKAAEDVNSPLSGVVTAVNEALKARPEVINQDPFGAAWFFRVRLADPAEVDSLMDVEAYRKYVAGLEA